VYWAKAYEGERLLDERGLRAGDDAAAIEESKEWVKPLLEDLPGRNIHHVRLEVLDDSRVIFTETYPSRT
jgi:hypothetical protein